jgi:translation initiation factor IF-2
LRAGAVVYKGKIRSLKRVKDDVKDVGEGIECGIAFEGFDDIKKGDLVESFTIEKIARRLESKKK